VEPARVPDGISAIIAYRIFLIDPGGPTLVSPFQEVPWPIGEPFEARCGPRSDPDHVPGERCRCGVYAFRHPAGAISLSLLDHDASYVVIGKVALWGKGRCPLVDGDDVAGKE
jgi:hypothetical protein